MSENNELIITNSVDQETWYSKFLGRRFYIPDEDDEFYYVRNNYGCRASVYKQDAEPLWQNIKK